VQRTGDMVRFVDRESGELALRRMVPHLATKTSRLIEEARAIHGWLDIITYSDRLKLEPDEILKGLYDDIRTIKHRSWMAQAAIINEMQSRSSYGDKVAKHVAAALGCHERTVWSRGQIFRDIIENPECSIAVEVVAEEGFYKEAVSSEDPVGAIKLAAERKIEDQSYTVSRFRAELKTGGKNSTLRSIVVKVEERTEADLHIADQLAKRYGVPVEVVVLEQSSPEMRYRPPVSIGSGSVGDVKSLRDLDYRIT
jgi:hypothetical protein